MPRVKIMLVEAGGRNRWPVFFVAVAHGVHRVHFHSFTILTICTQVPTSESLLLEKPWLSVHL